MNAQHIRLFRANIKDLVDCALAESNGSVIGYLDEAMDVVDMLCAEINDDLVSELNFE